jgi:hypothetical protein
MGIYTFAVLGLLGKRLHAMLGVWARNTWNNAMRNGRSSITSSLHVVSCVQVYCYEDNRLLKLFKDIVRLLYNAEIVGEDTILHW